MDNIVRKSDLVPVSIEQEMKDSYLTYAMSVIVSRAIPDARDGLKPVHRRILHAMHESGNDCNKPYRKSARIVGEVMGKYHPHGDSAIYDALVRMAQPFSMRLMLIDGQGNFGSIDADPPAAMRYTESRLAKAAHSLISDIDKNTVDFQDNYDGSEKEPVVLPAQFPNLLVNGSGGIAVGMATNIPPHNLGELIDACCLYIDNPGVTVDELMQACPAPDFPTGGTILGRMGARAALATGRGSVIMRGKAHMERIGNRDAVIITEIPYQVNKAKMVERIGELVREKKIEGIADLRDESDKSGIRVVVEVKKDANADVILNQLYHLTPLQTSFGVNMLALDRGRPRLMNLRDVIEAFVVFREEVISRRTAFLLGKARERAHILIGLAIAVSAIDKVIAIIRGSADPAEAREKLLKEQWPAEAVRPLIDLVDDSGNLISGGNIYFTDAQVRAILEMKLSRLTNLESGRINDELQGLASEIKEYLSILGNREKLMALMKTELLDVKEEFADPRRTQIEESEFEQDIEDLIQREDMVVTVTQRGYIKRVPLALYRAQRRGGKGRAGVALRDEEDFARKVFVVNTHTPVLYFSNFGKVYKLKVYKLPVGGPTTVGKALINIFPLAEGEEITNVMPLPEDESLWDSMNIMFATTSGNIRRNDLSDFKDIRSGGKIAIKLDEGDRLVGVRVCNPEDHVMLASRSGQAVRFEVNDVRVFKSRTSDGVRGMKLKEQGDSVVSISILKGFEAEMEDRTLYLKIPSETRLALAKENGEEALSGVDAEIAAKLGREKILELARNEEMILAITENGYGKRSSSYEYRVTNRGGSGIVNIETSERNGEVAGCFTIAENDQIMIVTDKGKLIRCPVKDIRIAGRATQGVTILKTADGEKVVSATRIQDADQDDDVQENESTGEANE